MEKHDTQRLEGGRFFKKILGGAITFDGREGLKKENPMLPHSERERET